MQDKTIICKECEKEFTFSAEEQEFYASKGFNDPLRCKECRDARKAERASRQENTTSRY